MQIRNVVLLTAAAVLCTGVAVTCGVLLLDDDDNSDGGSSSTSSFVEEQQQGEPSVTPSQAPSRVPSSNPSTVPTTKPSPVPSLRPSASPTTPPSPSPSATPTTEPSPSPSDTPTITASNEPSPEPSELPTTVAPSAGPSIDSAPTVPPTTEPTTLSPTNTFEPTTAAPAGGTDAPTFDLPDATEAFRIKMHWEEDFFWQEEAAERQWCISCCECDELNFSEFPEDFNCQSSYCAPGDQLWLRDCEEDYGAAFRMKRDGKDGIMLRVVESGRSTFVAGQCLTRTMKRYLQVQPCNASDTTQRWRSISASEEFPLISYYKHRQDKNETYCVTQHHHPKSYEILGLKDCPEANSDDTGEWVVINVPDWYNV